MVFAAFGFVQAAEKPAPADAATLSSLTQEALSKNPKITAAWRKWNALRARIGQAKAWDDPKVSFDVTAGRFVEMPPNAMADQTLILEQMIPVSGKNVSRGRIAAAEAITGYEDFRRQQLDVASDVKAAYFQLLNTRALLAINARNAVSLGQIAEATRAKYKAGSEMAPDALRAQIESTKIDQERRDLERLQSESQTRLNVLMNRPMSSPIGDLRAASLPPPKLTENALANMMLVSRPEIRAASAQVEAERSRVQLAKREWIPDPAINVNAQRYNGAAQTVSQVGTGISFSIPWVNPGKYSEGVREASENAEAAGAALLSVKSESLGLLHDQLKRIEIARQNYELYRDSILPQAQQVFDATQLNYSAGKATFTDWITAQRALRDVQISVSTLLADYQTAIAELDAIVGADLSAPPKTVKKAPPVSRRK
jgi:outer membrane protein TolC